MKLRAGLTLLFAAALAACSGSLSKVPSIPGGRGAAPTPPSLGLVLSHQNFTKYMFRNTSTSNGLPTSPPNDGGLPKGTLTIVQSGGTTMLYGRTASGGNPSVNCGTFFSTGLNFGSSYQIVRAFSGSDGCDPRHDAMVLINGTLYSTTQGVSDSGVSYNNGDVHGLVPGGSPSIVHMFAGGPGEGAQQHSSLILDGMFGKVLFGQTAKGGDKDKGQVYAITPDGATYYDVHDFHKEDGSEPHGRIMQLGNTLWGITRTDGAGGDGTVFSLVISYVNGIPQPQPQLNVIHSFVPGGSDADFSDHGYLTPVTENGQVVLYGLTQCGGGGKGDDSHHCGSGKGDGAIIRVVPAQSGGVYTGAASYSVFYDFKGQSSNDGADPYGSLFYDPVSQYLYGMTAYGGSSDDDGTIFRFKPGDVSSYQVLYHFTGKNGDGAKPIDNVVILNGVMYGMTVYGGTTDDAVDGMKGAGNGTIFAMPVP